MTIPPGRHESSMRLLGEPPEEVSAEAVARVEAAIVRYVSLLATATGVILMTVAVAWRDWGVAAAASVFLLAGAYAVFQRRTGRPDAFGLLVIMVGLIGLLLVTEPREIREPLESSLPVLATVGVLFLDRRRSMRFLLLVAAVWGAGILAESYQESWRDLGDTSALTGEVVILFLFAFGVLCMGRAKRELVSSETRYRLLFQESPIGAVITAPDGHILDANPALIEMLGYADAETFLSTPVRAFWVRPEERHHLIETLVAGPVDALEVELRRLDGSSIWARVSGIYNQVDDTIKLLVADVTQERIRRQSLTDQLADKDRFMATVSHTIRTPLTAVVGSVAELRDRLAGREEDMLDELSLLAAQQADGLALLVDNLVVIGRRQRGLSVSVHPEVTPLRPLVDLVVGLLVDDRMTVRVVGEESAWADPLRTRQILRNLVDNAWKGGGDNIEVMIGREGAAIVVRVVDDGSGIPPDLLPHIFDRYESSDLTPARSLGIGLHVNRMLAESMGGRLRHERENGLTVFELRLPADEPAAE